MENLPDRIAKIKEELRALRTNGSGYNYHKYFVEVSPTSTSGDYKYYTYTMDFVPDIGKNEKCFCELSLVGVGGMYDTVSYATVTLGDRFKGTATLSVYGSGYTVYASAVSNQTGELVVS